MSSADLKLSYVNIYADDDVMTPKTRFCTALLLGLLALSQPAFADGCHPEITAGRPQFVVGYGSLMERASKLLSAPTSGPNHPIRVTGFQRAWNTRGGSDIGFSTIFLGVTDTKDAPMFAAIYQDRDGTNIAGTDAREISYCRKPVDPRQIELLDGWKLPANAETWIYVNKPDHVGQPDERRPIVQSYVDIFLTGCFDMAESILPETASDLDFPTECIKTTAGWSEHWVNDRLYPRRPFIYQKRAFKIDALLAKNLPELFEKIAIE
jgi:hypothetical protein